MWKFIVYSLLRTSLFIDFCEHLLLFFSFLKKKRSLTGRVCTACACCRKQISLDMHRAGVTVTRRCVRRLGAPRRSGMQVSIGLFCFYSRSLLILLCTTQLHYANYSGCLFPILQVSFAQILGLFNSDDARQPHYAHAPHIQQVSFTQILGLF